MIKNIVKKGKKKKEMVAKERQGVGKGEKEKIIMKKVCKKGSILSGYIMLILPSLRSMNNNML